MEVFGVLAPPEKATRRNRDLYSPCKTQSRRSKTTRQRERRLLCKMPLGVSLNLLRRHHSLLHSNILGKKVTGKGGENIRAQVKGTHLSTPFMNMFQTCENIMQWFFHCTVALGGKKFMTIRAFHNSAGTSSNSLYAWFFF